MTKRTTLTLLGVIAVTGFLITTVLWFLMYVQPISRYRWFFSIPIAFAVAAILAVSRLRKIK